MENQTMTRKTLKILEEHNKKLLIGVLTGAICLVGVGGLRSLGDEVYQGKMEGKNINYKEGRFHLFGSSAWFNRMIVSSEDTTYTLIDDWNRQSIQWENQYAPNWGKDSLEKVIIKTPTDKMVYIRGNIDTTTINGIHAQNVFNEADQTYDHYRKEIRKKLREDYQSRASLIERGLIIK